MDFETLIECFVLHMRYYFKYRGEVFFKQHVAQMYLVYLISAFPNEYLVNIRKIVFGLQEKIRHLLRVSGVSSFVYWFELFIADAIIFLIPMVLMLILIPAFQLPSLSPPPAMGCLVLALFLYLSSGILFSYLLSFPFSSWDVAQQVLPNVYTFVSL